MLAVADVSRLTYQFGNESKRVSVLSAKVSQYSLALFTNGMVTIVLLMCVCLFMCENDGLI